MRYTAETTARIDAFLKRIAINGMATVDIAALADNLAVSFRLAKSYLLKACTYQGYKIDGNEVDMRQPLPRICRKKRHRITKLERFHQARMQNSD